MGNLSVACTVVGVLLLAACAAPAPTQTNYGHPALNSSFNQAPPAPAADPGRMALGALAGGLIGSRFGSGSGRIAATGAGAAIGAMAGQGGGFNTDMAIGGLLGGLVGSRFGEGSGRLAATAIGAGLGAFLTVPRQ
jgi:uncharacterized protein YcfJ